MGERPPLAARVLVALVTFIVTLVVADTALRAYFHVPANFLKKITHKDPAALPPKGLKPNLDVTLIGEFKEFKFRLTTDAEGFRTTLPKAGPPYEVVFLGDSQTAGTGMDDADTFASLTARELGRAVLNAGCYGYSTVEEWLVARRVVPTYKPKDVVLCFYAGNDPYENFRFRRYLTGEAGAGAKSPKPPRGIDAAKQWLIQNSSIYNLLIRLRRYPAINDALYKMNLLQTTPPNELVVYKKGESELKKAFWRATEEALLKVRDEAEASNARFHVVNIPDRCRIDAAYWQGWVKKYRLNSGDYDLMEPARRMKFFCEKNSIDFLDLNDVFMKEAAKGESSYWKMDLHLSKTGNRIVAREIVARLRRTG